MAEVSRNDRLLRQGVTSEESKLIEKVLRRNNISYFEKWNTRGGIFKFFEDNKNSRCDIYIHMDSVDKAKQALAEAGLDVRPTKKVRRTEDN